MKKFLAISLTVLMIVCTALPAFAASDKVSGDYLDDSLILHYDFESTGKGFNYDKAPGGKSTEFITVKDNISAKNGVMTVTGFNGAVTFLGNASETAKGADLMNISTGEMTFFTSFQVKGLEKPGATSIWNNLFCFYKQNNVNFFRPFFQQDSKEEATVDGKANLFFMGADGKAVSLGDINYQTEEWLQLAVSTKLDAEKNVWHFLAYLSTDSGRSFKQVMKKDFETSVLPADFCKTAQYLAYGNQNSKGSAVYSFDDCRVYNKALTVEELQYHLNVSEKGAAYHGVQNSVISADNKFSVRFVGSIDSSKYQEVGFKVRTADGSKNWNVPATSVFKTLLAKENEQMKQYAVADLRGTADGYLYALTIQNIPADMEVTFIVTPYHIENAEAGEVLGASYQVTYRNGAYVSSSAYTGA